MKVTHNLYSEITSLENLFQAWNEFKNSKRKRLDVQIFERDLENNLFSLHEQLIAKTYQHQGYIAFNIYDPKFRHIHKAKVLDRIVHHAVVKVLEPIFDKTFIFDSYSCRTSKGLHKAVKRLFTFVRKTSKNYTANCFALKLDIKKFFASVDHVTLLEILRKQIGDQALLDLIESILKSFSKETGIPIGNLTSQIFANIYLNKLDEYIKHELKIKYYLRYCDDFVILSSNKNYLKELVPNIEAFLQENLKLSLHENKIVLRKYTQGIDFLGYIVLPRYILPRTKTKRRILAKLKLKIVDLEKGQVSEESYNQSLASYLGFLKHSNSFRLSQRVKNLV